MWSGRERKAYPPTYGCQLGSPRSQLLLRGSATWVSPCLFYLLSISMPAAHRPSRDALLSRSLTVYHFPISSPMAWCGFFISFLSAWLSWRISQATAGSAWTLLMPFLSFSAGPLVWTYQPYKVWYALLLIVANLPLTIMILHVMLLDDHPPNPGHFNHLMPH